MKAIVNKETAERILADEELQVSLGQQIRKLKKDQDKDDELNKMMDKIMELEGKIDKAYESLLMKFKNGQVESEALLEELQYEQQKYADQLNMVQQQLVDLQDEVKEGDYGTAGLGNDTKRAGEDSPGQTTPEKSKTQPTPLDNRAATPLDDRNNADKARLDDLVRENTTSTVQDVVDPDLGGKADSIIGEEPNNLKVVDLDRSYTKDEIE